MKTAMFMLNDDKHITSCIHPELFVLQAHVLSIR